MAELSDIIKHNDLMGEVISYHSGGLSRKDIDIALEANGYTLPLPNKVSFHLYKMNGLAVSAIFMVTWFPIADVYGMEKLTLK